jgi:hypothetical protein
MALDQLKLLINLASVDGEVGEKEEKYIANIGAANGVSAEMINPLFGARHEVIVPDNLTIDQKFQYMLSLVQLMKIDEKLYQEEIRFCAGIAAKLGYDKSVMIDLMLNVRTAMQANELEELKKMTTRYLNKP